MNCHIRIRHKKSEVSIRGKFDDLKRFLDDLGSHFTLLCEYSVLQSEFAVLHLLLGLVSRPSEPHDLLEGLPLVGDEVDRALAVAQKILTCVR